MMARRILGAVLVLAATPALAQGPVKLYPRDAPAAAPRQDAPPMAEPSPAPAIAPPAAPVPPPPAPSAAPMPPAAAPPSPLPPKAFTATPLPPPSAPERSAPTPAPVPADDAVAVVEAFYAALARGDGRQANEYLVPEKRNQGAYEVAAMTRFYSSMREPLRVVGMGRLDPAIIRVQYTYTHQSGRHCDGVADVTVHRVGGRTLIERIRALSGC